MKATITFFPPYRHKPLQPARHGFCPLTWIKSTCDLFWPFGSGGIWCSGASEPRLEAVQHLLLLLFWKSGEGFLYFPAQPNWQLNTTEWVALADAIWNHQAECSQPMKLWNTINCCFKSLNFGRSCYKEFDNWNTFDTLVIPNYPETTMSVSLHILLFCSCLCPLYKLLVHFKDPTKHFLFCEVFPEYLRQSLFMPLDVPIYWHSTYFFHCPFTLRDVFGAVSTFTLGVPCGQRLWCDHFHISIA